MTQKAFQNTPASRQLIQTQLAVSNLIIEFTKADGSTRLMTATLRPEVISQYFVGREAYPTPTTVGDTHQAVWDLGANAWRSFRWDSVQRIESELEFKCEI